MTTALKHNYVLKTTYTCTKELTYHIHCTTFTHKPKYYRETDCQMFNLCCFKTCTYLCYRPI